MVRISNRNGEMLEMPTFWTEFLERHRLCHWDLEGDIAEMDSYSLTHIDYIKKSSSQPGPQPLTVKVLSATSSCLVPDPMSTVIFFHSPGFRILGLKKAILFVQRDP